MKKPSYLKDSIATADGYLSPKGEMLKRRKMTQEEMDAWNGVEKKKKTRKKKADVVEVAVTEEIAATDEAGDGDTVGEDTGDSAPVQEEQTDNNVEIETTLGSKLKNLFGTK